MTEVPVHVTSRAGGGVVLALVLVIGVAFPWYARTAGAAVGGTSEDETHAMLTRMNRTAQDTPYEGLRLISAWTPTGASSALIKVRHTPGHGTMVHVMGRTARQNGVMYERGGGSRAGNLAGETLRLLVDHYHVATVGTESTAGRQAYVVEARRGDGSLAARFWLDRATGLLLRREVHDRHGRIIRTSAFIELDVGESTSPYGEYSPPHGEHSPPATARPWKHRLQPGDISSLRTRGWTIPRNLPGGLRLVDARRGGAGNEVLHLSYSDGLFMVSLFVQRGRLATDRLDGWRKTTLDGGCVVYRQRTVPRRAVWFGDGHVYTLVADAPPEKVRRVVGALPHSTTRPGFWGRMMRGFGQLGTWLNPFG